MKQEIKDPMVIRENKVNKEYKVFKGYKEKRV